MATQKNQTTNKNNNGINKSIDEIYKQALEEGTIINTYLDESLFKAYFLKEDVASFQYIPSDNAKSSTTESHTTNTPTNTNNTVKSAKIKKTKTTKAQRVYTKNEHDKYTNISNQFKKLKEELANLPEDYFTNNNETETINKIINPVLEILGFYKKSEQIRTINDIPYKPDSMLFSQEADFKKYNENPNTLESHKLIMLEAKKFNENIQNRKRNTAHSQIISYLSAFNTKQGILTNGREWLIYNTTNPSKTTPIIGMNLWNILFDENEKVTPLHFYELFQASNFNSNYFNKLSLENDEKIEENLTKLTQNLKNALYGEDSILETVGIAIYQQNKDENVEHIYHNALIVVFRIIFMLFYENKYNSYLKNHSAYRFYSIYKFYHELKAELTTENENNNNHYQSLINIWQSLNEGNETLNIPMLNGGLFSNQEAPLIYKKEIFNNKNLINLLERLIQNNNYNNLTVEKLGNIYEGLLSYEFKIAKQNLSLVKYKDKATKNKEVYTFVDNYTLETLKKEQKTLETVKTYSKNELYLTSYSNQRKTTASYYTPQVLSEFMVKEAINTQLSKGIKILDLKIIDNACGSGHFLVESLNYLSEICNPDYSLNAENNQHKASLGEQNNSNNPYYVQIETEIIKEKLEIINNINKLVENQQEAEKLYPEDSQIIKRFLLKKLIYGVDLNKIAVEITKISLWIETFIFGTPLSFIEHHIKCGNSLIYSSIEDFINFEQNTLEKDLFKAESINIETLQQAYTKINQLNDNNEKNIKESKKTYHTIEEKIESINIYLNFLNYYNFKSANKINIDVIHCFNIMVEYYIEKKEHKNSTIANQLINKAPHNLNKNSKKVNFNSQDFIQDFEKFINDYKPFNIEVEFPDAFNYSNNIPISNHPQKSHKIKAIYSSTNSEKIIISKNNITKEIKKLDKQKNCINIYDVSKKSLKVNATYSVNKSIKLMTLPVYVFNKTANKDDTPQLRDYNIEVVQNKQDYNIMGTSYVVSNTTNNRNSSDGIYNFIYRYCYCYCDYFNKGCYYNVQTICMEQDNKISKASSNNSQHANFKSPCGGQNLKSTNVVTTSSITTSGVAISGFQIVVGNPPWEVNKFTETEFFSQYQSNYRSLTHKEKESARERLFANFNLQAIYEQQQTFIRTINEYYKAKYPHNQGSGDTNLYALFMERNLKLLAPQGTMYYLTPSLWTFADSSINLRKYLFNNFNLTKLFCFENREKLFDIDSRYKFALYQINNGSPTSNFNCFFMQTSPESLENKSQHINISIEEIKSYSANELAIIELNNILDKQVIFKAHNQFNNFNEKYVKFGNELHMTKHKNLMQESQQNGLIPLYEGKIIEQFDSKLAKFTYYVDNKSIPNKNKKINKENTEETASYNQNLAELQFYNNYHQHTRLVFRAIASSTNQRTLIASLIPQNSISGNSLTVSIPSNHATTTRLLFTASLFNSIMLDFIIRKYIELNVNLTYIKRLPMPMPSDEEIKNHSDYTKLVINTAKLTYLYNPQDFASLKEEYNLQTENFPKTEEAQRRYLDNIKVENDCIILKMYNITMEELNHMLDSFKALQNKNPQYIQLLKDTYTPNCVEQKS